MKIKNVKHYVKALLVGSAVTLAGCGNKHIEQEPINGTILEETEMSQEEKFKDKEIVVVEELMDDDNEDNKEISKDKKYSKLSIKIMGTYDPIQQKYDYAVMKREDNSLIDEKIKVTKKEFVNLFGTKSEEFYEDDIEITHISSNYLGVCTNTFCNISYYIFQTKDNTVSGLNHTYSSYMNSHIIENKSVDLYDEKRQKNIMSNDRSKMVTNDEIFYNDQEFYQICIPMDAIDTFDNDLMISEEKLMKLQAALDEVNDWHDISTSVYNHPEPKQPVYQRKHY